MASAKNIKKEERLSGKKTSQHDDRGNTRIAFFVIIAVTIIAFFPSLQNGITNWDDDKYLVENPFIRDISWNGIQQISSAIVVGNYHPVTVLSYAIEYNLFRLIPTVYHVTNLFLHVLNSLMVFWFIYRLQKNMLIAFAVGLMFGVHPLHVESVAWISERKDLLYTAFFVGALLSYLSYIVKNKHRRLYIASIVLFMLSCLSKGMAVVLPVILFIIDYHLGRKINKHSMREKIPFFLIALIFGVIAVIAQHAAGATRGDEAYPIVDRPFIAFYGLMFYLYKMLVPIGLSCIYPYPAKTGGYLPPIFYVAPFILLIIGGILWRMKKFRKEIVFGMAFFVICLLPVLQLLPVGYAIVADRYFYLSSIGVFYILGVGFSFVYEMAKEKGPGMKTIVFIPGAMIILVLSFLTWNRTEIWKDSISLLENASKQYPAIPSLYNNIGMAYGDSGNVAKELEYYQKTVELDPRITEPYINMAFRYASMDENEKAIACYNKVIELEPDEQIAYFNVGILYAKTGKDSMGILCLQRAARLGNKESRDWLRDNGYGW